MYASSFTPDNKPPKLSSVRIDLNASGNIKMTFDDIVKASKINVSSLKLIYTTILGEKRFSISDDTKSIEDDFSITLGISKADLDSIKLLNPPALWFDSPRISFSSFFIEDMYENLVISEMGQVIDFVQRDETAPIAQQFSLDLNLGQLIVDFDEPVYSDSFRASLIKFSSSKSNSVFQPTSFSIPVSDNGKKVVVVLHEDDKNEINAISDLCTATTNCLLSLEPNTVHDMFHFRNNNSKALPNYNLNQIGLQIKQTNGFVPDTTSPYLKSFIVDLHQGMLRLEFNEYVNVSTFNPTFLSVLGNRAQNPYRLQGGFNLINTPGPSLIFDLQLTSTDLNFIKNNISMFNNAEDSFIILDKDYVEDTSGNKAQEINASFAINATHFFDDKGSPSLMNFTVDMDKEQVTLSFNEPVNTSSFHFLHKEILKGFSFQASEEVKPTVLSRKLSQGTSVFNSLSQNTIVTLSLKKEDTNYFKKVGIFASESTSYITIDSTAVRDNRGFPVTPTGGLTGKKIKNGGLTLDRTAPKLESFRLDLNSKKLALRFSET
eukprot:UC4_evm1s1201